MQLTIFNGSPRGKKSNTTILMDHFVQGMNASSDHDISISYLIHTQEVGQQVELFKKSDYVIIAFPLYTDAMPAIVKNFIEKLQPFCGQENNPGLGFVVQSGFPEPIHSRAVEKYLEKLTLRLGSEYIGTIVKGGVEGIQMMPASMTKKLFKNFYKLGVGFEKTLKFDPVILKKITPREKMSFSRLLVFKMMSKIGLGDFYWNSQLKKNGVFEQRFARPF